MPELYPDALVSPVAEGRALRDRLAGTQPSAGAGFSLSLDGRYTTRLVAITFRLVTDANAGTRTVRVAYKDAAGNLRAFVVAPLTQAASKTIDYSFARGISAASSVADLMACAALAELFLDPTDAIAVDIDTVKAGDQLSAIVLTVERFPTDAAH